MTSQPSAELCRSLGDRVQAGIAEALGAAGEVAFVNFPHVRNIGDSAIWLGTRDVLERLGVSVAYECEPPAYRRGRLAARLGERGTILIQGGGNLGDVHRPQQSVRARVLSDFPHAHVVQLPQSIHFQREESRETFGELARSHDDFTLIVRDRPSLETAERLLGVPATLLPDMAFGLTPRAPAARPGLDVVWLARGRGPLDAGEAAGGGTVERLDWAGRDSEEGLPRRVRALARSRRTLAGPPPRRGPGAGVRMSLAARLHRPLARGRLDAGLSLLSAGRAVLTDRLHGHILALLLGIPQVVLPDDEGKVRGAYDEWTSAADVVHWSESPAEGLQMAMKLARESPGGGGG